jgi:hypothetical protein
VWWGFGPFAKCQLQIISQTVIENTDNKEESLGLLCLNAAFVELSPGLMERIPPMARPLFDIAREISSNWHNPSNQAKTYLKGMYYLLGIDDQVADLDAATTVRMFLLYSKEWSGAVADRVKAELKEMRSSKSPKNADLLQTLRFTAADSPITHCELCSAELAAPAKYVDGYTHWNVRARMCVHCNFFLSPGLDAGDGALYLTVDKQVCVKLHGEPNNQSKASDGSKIAINAPPIKPYKMKLRHQLKLFGRRAVRKVIKVVGQMWKRSA